MEIPEKPESWQKTMFNSTERTLDLIKDKEIFDFIKECNKEYIPWDKLRRKQIPKNKNPKQIWALIKFFRSEKYIYLDFNELRLKYVLLPDTLKKLHFLDKESAGNLQIDDRIIHKQGQERYIISSLMEEAIASSQLEGAATTRRIAKEMLRQNRKPKNKSEKMIMNGYNTLKMILERKEEKLSENFLIEIQKSITKDTLLNKEDEGNLRKNNNIVIGDTIELEKIFHNPPNYENIPNLLQELYKFANEDGDEFIHPIIKGIILHFLIGYIHPFNDGNGRTARAIFYWYVISKGYWLFEYTPISRKILSSKVDYGKSYLYSETDENDLTYFILFNIKAISEALNDMTEYIKKKQKEQIITNELVTNLKEIDFRQASILKEIMKSPNKYFTIKEFQEMFNVVYETARKDLLDLVKKNYLTIKKVKNKFIFIFTKINQEQLTKDTKKSLG